MLKKLLILLILSGCSASYKRSIEFDPVEPLRVAVLPFHQVDEDGNVVDSSPQLFLVDNLTGSSKEEKEPPSTFIQKLVETELKKTTFDIVPPNYVRAQLVHSQFTKDLSYDHTRIHDMSAKALCELLSCDALLYGKITKWDRSYYILQSVNTVGLELKIVRAADAEVLFSSNSVDHDSRGLSKGPTGYTSLVVEPIRGLDNEIISDLARRVTSESLAPLFVKNRPEFLETSAPGIYASTHNAPNNLIKQRRPLTVLMYGTSDLTASFSIGSVIENIPMTELARGHYLGVYYPLKTDKFQDQNVTVSLSDKFGRSSHQNIGLGSVTLQ